MQRFETWMQNKLDVFCQSFPIENERFVLERVKYKRCGNYLVLLYVPESSITNEKRSVIDKRFAKYRANSVYCIAIYDSRYENDSVETTCRSTYYTPTVEYKIGSWVYADQFNPNIDAVCSNGIHYFNHWMGACFYDSVVNDSVRIVFMDDGGIWYVRMDEELFHCTDTDRKENVKLLETRLGVTGLEFTSCFLN